MGLKTVSAILGLCALSVGIYSCGGSSSSGAYSADATFGSPFVSTSGSSQVERGTRTFAAALTPTAKRAQVQALLSETTISECNFDLSLSVTGVSFSDCYGPEVTLGTVGQTWPDAGGDITTIPVVNDDPSDGNNPLPTGDLGIWNAESTGGVACAATQVNNIVESMDSNHHLANMLGASAECYFNPESAGAISLSDGATELTSYGTVLSAGGSDTWTISSIAISQITDSNGDAGYRYEIAGSWIDVLDDESSKTYSFVVKTQHIAPSTGELKGTLSYAFTNAEETSSGNCSDVGSPDGMTYAGDLIYNRISSTEVRIRAASAEFCGEASPLGTASENFLLDPCDFASGSNTTGWANNFNYALINYDPADYDGTYAYAWQAGRGDRATRIFNASIETDGSTRSGTAYFGFGDQIQDNPSLDSCTGYSSGLGSIDGMICNWAGPNSLADGSEFTDYIQSQTMTANTSDNIWSASVSKIKFAPVNSCKFNPGDFGSFSYTSGSTLDNDSDVLTLTDEASTIGLEDIANYSFTLPTVPSLSIVE